MAFCMIYEINFDKNIEGDQVYDNIRHKLLYFNVLHFNNRV